MFFRGWMCVNGDVTTGRQMFLYLAVVSSELTAMDQYSVDELGQKYVFVCQHDYV